MFGRSTDQKTEERERRDLRAVAPPPGTREATAVTVSQGHGLPPRSGDDSVIAAEDRIEGKFKTAKGVRILGTVDGSIESASHVHIEQSAKVTADVTAEEVVIGGHYSGKLTCRQRLEILPTGRVTGNIETDKLMLHEGGYVDGELHMKKPNNEPGAETPRPGELGRTPEGGVRPLGSMRSTVEPSIRQAAGTAGSASTTATKGGDGSNSQ